MWWAKGASLLPLLFSVLVAACAGSLDIARSNDAASSHERGSGYGGGKARSRGSSSGTHDHDDGCPRNDRPIIAILTIPRDKSAPEDGASYMAASYVKWVEAAGGRVAPLDYSLSPAEVEELLSKVQGVLFTGGSVYFDEHHVYYRTAKTILDYAVRVNSLDDDYFPVMGICLGFEVILTVFADDAVRSDMDADEISLVTNFVKEDPGDAHDVTHWNGRVSGSGSGSGSGKGGELEGDGDSRGAEAPALASASAAAAAGGGAGGDSAATGGVVKSVMFNSDNFGADRSMHLLATQALAYHAHHFGFSLEQFHADAGLTDTFRLLATSFDREGLEFVSIVEGINLPVFAVQFHPEKPVFEWREAGSGIVHTPAARDVSRYLADFFVDLTRKAGSSSGSSSSGDESRGGEAGSWKSRRSDRRKERGGDSCSAAGARAFSSWEEEHAALVYQYAPVDSGLEPNSTFQQKYYFNLHSGDDDDDDGGERLVGLS